MAPHERQEPTTPINGRVEVRPGYDGRYHFKTVYVDGPCDPYVAAPGQQARCGENRGGDFYTDCDSCLFCEVPFEEAPDLMAFVQHPPHPRAGKLHCVFTRQPRTPEEIERALSAMCGSETCGIRYGGSDPAILSRLMTRGASGLHP